MIGSINIIGNPVGFLNNVSEGFGDLIKKPKEGFEKGPLFLGLGIIDGVSSLVRKTIVGGCNSINKVTISLANGILNKI